MEAVEIDALATAGPNVDVADLRAPKNVHLVRGAPHDLVMKDVSVVISQGGHGTTTRSLINGLPQLILPMGRRPGCQRRARRSEGGRASIASNRLRSGNCRGGEPIDCRAAIQDGGPSARRGHESRYRSVRPRRRDGGDRRHWPRGETATEETTASKICLTVRKANWRRTVRETMRRSLVHAALASTLPIQLRASVTSACDN